MSTLVDLLAVEALARRASLDRAGVAATLHRALVLAEPGGFVRTFLDKGAPMLALLQAAIGEAGWKYARRLLAAPERPLAGATTGLTLGRDLVDSAAVGRCALHESLTRREIEVLQLLAWGASNQEIAGCLVVSLPTVKKHVANIMGKLGAESRTRAVARARELGLV